MKHFFFVILCVFLLFSCGSDEEGTVSTNETASSVVSYEWEEFSVVVPASWQNLLEQENALPNPSTGTLEAAFGSRQEKEWVVNNLVFISTPRDASYTSVEFSVVNHNFIKTELRSFESIDSKEVVFKDGEKSEIYVFSGQYNSGSEILKFIQTGRHCGEKSYLMTFSLPSLVGSTEKYEKLLRSFECKK